MTEKPKFTPAPWRWADDWKIAEKQDQARARGGPDRDDLETEKYLDLRLLGPNDEEILPTRIDHRELIVDSALDAFISRPNRALISAAPDMYEALDGLRKEVLGALKIADAEIRAALGNTNVSVILHRLEVADRALAKADSKVRPQDVEAGKKVEGRE